MSDPILGMITLWPVSWVPEGWALCNGQSLSIQQNAALYSLIGTRYGGDGTTNFNLPDLRNKVPVGATSPTSVGQTGGAATATVTAVGTGSVVIGVNNLPAHNHTGTFTPGGTSSSVSIAIPVASGVTEAQSTTIPSNTTILANVSTGSPDPVNVYTTQSANTTLKPFNVTVPAGGGTVTIGNTGSGQALPVTVSVPVSVNNMQPYLTLNYIIAIQGSYPMRA